MADEPAAEPGLRCRKCGCRDLRVYYTRRKNGRIVRRRRCRHCGTLTTTTEKQNGTQ